MKGDRDMASARIKQLTIWSPLLIIAIFFLVAFLVGNAIGAWVWVPIMLGYWTLIAFLIWANGGKALVAQWLAPSQGPWYWNGLALVWILPLLPTFLGNLHFYSEWWIVVLTLVFVPINPWFEEGYWRGLLLDRTSEWPGWISLLYSSVRFAANHLTLGVHSVAIRHPIFLVPTGLMGLTWGIVYRKTKSLRWVILGHFLVNSFALTVPALMNLYLPTG
jgi:membrane protease YdiL (CAAX protease family)